MKMSLQVRVLNHLETIKKIINDFKHTSDSNAQICCSEFLKMSANNSVQLQKSSISLTMRLRGVKIKVSPEITVKQIHLILFASCRTNVGPPKSGLRLSRKVAAFKVESYQPSRSYENT